MLKILDIFGGSLSDKVFLGYKAMAGAEPM